MSNEKVVLIVLTIFYLPVVVIELLFYLRKSKTHYFNLKKFLKYNLILLVLGTIAIAVLSHTNFLDYEKPIPYKDIDSITFKNFRGLELFKKELYGSKHFAYVVTSIDSEIDGNSVSIESYFYPSRSFVYDKKLAGNHLLSHEIYHFKITELFARKSKQKIVELDKSKSEKIEDFEIEQIINEFKKEERIFQTNYDNDTFHSYVFSQQKKYERHIDSLLYLLDKFKIKKITLNEKS